ncbi:LysR family transcriptional regulator [Pseudooceanicola spongiae]|uniref:HTH-type transcriptional regulator MetR n=1 Tax=Pseudooceanicola spongiae TaxID=2613965 RepID=A0A7L9WKE2_9RHOB|nr:LysR family transcriptional regulator [Pseudooceanicola spongiae]QOL80861.1 LysR family transcriptional regulator [Pseudooceanicola spongiae]
MHIELRHLRTIRAIHEAGGLAKAADLLRITQSALSHQIKGLEEQVGMELFGRRTKPMRLSAAGLRLLRVADRVLPEIEALEVEFDNLRHGSAGRLHIAIECHACFEWLLPVLELFRHTWNDVDVDIRPGLAFSAIEALERETVDVVITSDPEDIPGITFAPLFDYSPLFVAAAGHPLADKPFIEPEDFLGETLLTYPVDRSRLDVFSMLLEPAGVEPAAIRRVELTEVILLLVASGRGVTVLPDWVLREVKFHSDYITRPITEKGLTRRMFAACRAEDTAKPFMAHFTRLARTEAVKLQRGRSGMTAAPSPILTASGGQGQTTP